MGGVLRDMCVVWSVEGHVCGCGVLNVCVVWSVEGHVCGTCVWYGVLRTVCGVDVCEC